MPKAYTTVQIRVRGQLDLESTLYSGQAFRWQRGPDGSHHGLIENRPVRVWTRDGVLHAHGQRPVPEQVQRYFRLDESHDEFLRQAVPDPGLRRALARFPGLRLLRQDPWEMLVSFIVSQNSNEAKIRRTIEALCRLCSDAIKDPDGAAHAFPAPAALASLSLAQLRSTGMGYRAPYVQAAAQEVASGRLEPHRLGTMPYGEAFDRLLRLDGVGPKVADCILLYGCDQRAAFPSDVWVRRFVRETYLRGPKNPSHERIRAFAWRHFGPQAGYAQHYLFHYRRVVGALDAKTS